MKRYIKPNYNSIKDVFGMSFIEYNANSGGNRTGDCVCRAISIAFNVDYNEVRRYLNKYRRELNTRTYKIDGVFSRIVKELGGSNATKVPKGITVEQFVDTHEDNNAYIMGVGKTNNHSTHLVTCRNGNLFDSWDSSQNLVNYYYTVPPSCFGEDLELSDIKDYLKQFVTEDIQDCLLKNYRLVEDKWFKKYVNNRYEIDEPEEQVRVKDYLVQIPLIFRFKLSNGSWKVWTFKVAYAFTPYMTYEDGLKFIEEKTKKRFHDKFYEIHKEIDEYEETFAEITDEDLPVTKYGYGSKSDYTKFLNTLPAWVQLRCRSIQIDKPKGGGYRSTYNYYLICTPLPEDKDKSDVKFYGPTADCIKEEIELYEDNFERVGRNYHVDNWGID